MLRYAVPMSIWSRISEALAALAKGEGLSAVFERLRTAPERSVAFTIAVIALGAKMAKADGQVTRDEVTAFREVFHIPASEERAAARVFNMAREDVAGFEDYAARIAAMFRSDDKPCGQDSVLCDLMEGLFHIAAADGTYHPGEDAFLERVAEIFGLDRAMFERMRARHTPGGAPDPTRFWASSRARISTPCARPGGPRCAPPIPTACSPAASRKRP
jgi:DnaJ like chaperone protein